MQLMTRRAVLPAEVVEVDTAVEAEVTVVEEVVVVATLPGTMTDDPLPLLETTTTDEEVVNPTATFLDEMTTEGTSLEGTNLEGMSLEGMTTEGMIVPLGETMTETGVLEGMTVSDTTVLLRPSRPAGSRCCCR
jgi:hypothetical protein